MGSVVDVVSVHAGQGDDPWLLESPIGWGVVQTVLDGPPAAKRTT